MIICPRCRSTEVTTWRPVDETARIENHCLNCGKHWNELDLRNEIRAEYKEIVNPPHEVK